MKLCRAILFVKDMERMLAFYSRTLGLTVKGEASPTWVELDTGGVTLGLHAIPDAIADGIVISDPPYVREETPIKLVFSVSDVEAERARLVGLGVTLSEVRSWGACDGVDPEGNVFQLARVQ